MVEAADEGGLEALGSAGGIVFDLLAIEESAEARAFNGGEVNEDVLTLGGQDEPVAFPAVIPFDDANDHPDTSGQDTPVPSVVLGTNRSDRHKRLANTQNGGPGET